MVFYSAKWVHLKQLIPVLCIIPLVRITKQGIVGVALTIIWKAPAQSALGRSPTFPPACTPVFWPGVTP